MLGRRQIAVDTGAPIDARIGAITAAQRGQVSRAQLSACEVSDGAIARRLRNGRLERAHPGVYRVAGAVDAPFGLETAALLACGEGAALSHHSAVTLWRLRPGVARPVHVTIPSSRGFRALAGVESHRSQTLAPADVRIEHGLPITSPARALLDVAAGLRDRDIELLLDEALFARRLLTLAEIDDLLARAGNHPGRKRLARVADGRTRSTRTDSPPEERLFSLIRAAALPAPRLQAHILGYRLDFLWAELALVVEVDAYGTHGSPARFEADRRRDARLLTEKGISVLRVTRAAIEQRPFEAIALVARAIGQREAR